MRELFESSVERLLADNATPQVRLACDQGAWPDALWDAAAESGFTLAAVPEALGGAGASWDDLFGVLLACGRHGAPIPLPEAILANWLLGRVGLQPIAGRLSFGLGTLLTLSGNRVSGTLARVPWGRHVETVVAVCGGARPAVIALSVADAKQVVRASSSAGEPRDDLHLDNAPAIAMAPLPDELGANVLFNGGALLRSAQIAGALGAVLEMTQRHASERVQFGKPIGNFQAIQHQIAVMAEHAALARSSSETACAEATGGFPLLPLAAAKVNASEAAGIAAGIAHAVHGAIGFTHEHTLHLSTRRLWAWRSEFGSSTHWSGVLGRAVCAGGAPAFWPAVTRGAFESSPIPS